MPEYFGTNRSADDAAEDDLVKPQFSLALTTCGIIRPNPAINGPLCAFAGVSLPAGNFDEPTIFQGVGSGECTKSGSSLGQAVRVEWSPNGLGQNLRPILSVLTTSGSIVSLGEHVDNRTAATAASARCRTFKHWKILWGLGARLPIPDGASADGLRYMNERVVSFAWSKEIGPGRALLAYVNDQRDVVVMAVQLVQKTQGQGLSAGEDESGWEIFEAARFDGRGRHDAGHAMDPDFVPSGGAYSVSWSPWFASGDFQTATIAYVAPHHVGFRRIVIEGEWRRGQDPAIQIEPADTVSICTFLSADAFVEWEDAIWHEGRAQMARGIIATPFVIKPFQVNLCGRPSPSAAQHSTTDCATLVPHAEETCTNPITGLVIHRPNPSNKPPEPLYSLVRLSATPTNQDWYQTNAPPVGKLPRWVGKIQRATSREVSRVEALAGVDSLSDTDSEFDEPEVDMTVAAEEEAVSKAHAHRYRLWGIAASPGGGCTAALVSKHATQHADRRPGSTVLFSWPSDARPAPADSCAPPLLTTEGRAWEAMHGAASHPGGFSSPPADEPPVGQESPLRALFRAVVPKQKCVFCNADLLSAGDESVCERGHPFATCTATGLAIMAPGVSRICAVCQLRCLNPSELLRIARQHLGAGAVVQSAGEVCGGCGGKFLV